MVYDIGHRNGCHRPWTKMHKKSDLIVFPTPVQTGREGERGLFVTFCSRENKKLLRNF